MRLRIQKLIIGLFAALCVFRLIGVWGEEELIGILILGGIVGVPAALAVAFLLGVGWCRRVLGIFCAFGLLSWTAFGWVAPDGTSDYAAHWLQWGLIEVFFIAVVAACFMETSVPQDFTPPER